MLSRRPSLCWGLFLVTVVCAGIVGFVPTADAQPKKDRGAEPKQNKPLAEKLTAIRDDNKLPALWGAIVEGEQLLAVAAVGVRKADSTEPVTVHDLVHLGSDTKAMTATLIALLIEKKKLRWDSTIGEVFSDLKDKIHADYLPVTVTQLLAHQGGLSANGLWLPTPKATTLREYRRSMLPELLKDAPASKPGTKFSYSNSGFVVAGAMAEAATGQSWEELMTTMLFKPLGMTSAGFGVPGTKGKVDQPWGHKLSKDKPTPSQIDNRPVLGPAGVVHCSMADWGKFASLHLAGAQGKDGLLKAETFERLHMPAEGFKYAGGWGVGRDKFLAHDGSNTTWYARIEIRPKDNVAFLIATNLGGDEAKKAMGETVKVLNDFYAETLRKK